MRVRAAADLLNYVYRWPFVAAWMCVIFGWSAIPGKALPSSVPSGLPVDKVAHVGEYAVLGSLIVGAASRGESSLAGCVAAATLVTTLYGASDEFHQRFVPGRDADLHDWLADAAGGTLGALATAIVVRRLRAADR